MKPPENPYFGLTEDQTTRFQSRIGKEDYAFLRGILVNGVGNVQLIVNYLVCSFINTCKKHGITTFLQRDDLWRLLDREYPLAGRAAPDTTGKAPARPKRSRVTRTRGQAAGATPVPADPQGDVAG